MSEGSHGFLITKELIFGFQILDLKDHFSASLNSLSQYHLFRHFLRNKLILVKCDNCLLTKSFTQVAVIPAYSESNLPLNKNTKHSRNIELPDCGTGFNFWISSCDSSFRLNQEWKLRTCFQFWAVSTFVPVQCHTWKHQN